MSHTVTINTQFKDLDILNQVCEKAGVKLLTSNAEVQLFSGRHPVIASFQLPQWHYPIGVQTDGSILFDNFEGRWGSIDQLHEIIQRYSCEKAKKEAYLSGYSVREFANEDGSIELLIDE